MFLEDGKLYFWELVEGTPLAAAQQGHGAAVLCLAFHEETLVVGPSKLRRGLTYIHIRI